MSASPPVRVSAVGAAGLCAAVVAAQFIAGKTVRDALYLANLEVTSLPAMSMATAAVSVALVGVSSKALRHIAPARFVPAMFVLNAVLLLVEWALAGTVPRVAAPLVYLHVSGLGPMLGSGFWLIATERFDPHTARKRFGRLAGMATLGGLAGGVLAERVATLFGAAAILPVLAVLGFVCAGLIRLIGPQSSPRGDSWTDRAEPDLAAEAPRFGLRVLAGAPYLRNLAALVLLSTVGAALVDYLFKAQAVAALGRGADLGRFFAVYYTTVNIIAFVVQALVNSAALERLGLAFVVSTPSLALLTGTIGGLAAPGLASVAAARGGESVFRSSLFRSAYEIFYTPVSAADKRAAKSLIDVGFDRLGEAVGGGLVRAVLFAAPTATQPTLFGLAIVFSVGAVAVASRLSRGYLSTLERSLLDRAVEVELADVQDFATRTVVLQTLQGLPGVQALAGVPVRKIPRGPKGVSAPSDPLMADIAALRSKDRTRVLNVLRRSERLPAALVAQVIPLLAWDAVASDAVDALKKVAEEHIGEFTDALVDPNQPFAVRRRLARAMSACTTQRAADGLFLGLEDGRFQVRFQCGRSLSAIHERNPDVRIDKGRTLEVVLREVTVGRPVWEGHRLLDHIDDPEPKGFVDDFLKDRTSQSLTHVFTLLSLVLPAEPLRIAFRGLHTTDQNLRGTALEYLDGVLPHAIRERLWPFLDDGRPAAHTQRPREAILEDLFKMNESVVLNLQELERAGGVTPRVESVKPKN